MARKTKDLRETSNLLATAIDQISELWEKCSPKFMTALEDSGKSRVTVTFSVTLDLAENAPVVDTQISFRDKTKEGGMDVHKSFRTNLTEELDDPNAPALPGMSKSESNGEARPEEQPTRGRRKKSENAETQMNEAA